MLLRIVPAPDAQRTFHALADPRRRELLDRIARSSGIRVLDLTRNSGVTQGAVSQHLKVLRVAGLVVAEPQGRNVYYRADPGGIAPVIDWLGHYQRFWPERIGRLRDLLAELDDE